MRDVVFISPDEDVLTAARRMRQHHVGSLVVCDEEEGDRYPVGMLTDRDLIVSVVTEDPAHARSLRVGDVMATDLLTGREDDDMYDALQRMRARGVRRLPVVDDAGRLVGILAFDDVVEWIADELQQLTRLVAREQELERTAKQRRA